MAPGLCIGEGAVAMAQATHGSAPDIAGKGIANPYAMIESSRMLIAWLGHDRGIPQAVAAAATMQRAIESAMADPACRTPDIRGIASTQGMTDAIVARCRQIDATADAGAPTRVIVPRFAGPIPRA
jgi:3-isopropylmalate dehydrogenase